jgi:hypothetical protein
MGGRRVDKSVSVASRERNVGRNSVPSRIAPELAPNARPVHYATLMHPTGRCDGGVSSGLSHPEAQVTAVRAGLLAMVVHAIAFGGWRACVFSRAKPLLASNGGSGLLIGHCAGP